MRTPYNVGPMNDMDLPTTRLGVMMKPSRSGGTTVAENIAFKMMRFGPMGHIGWYLNSDDAVKEYCRTIIGPMFNLNYELEAKVGTARGENTDQFKLVAGKALEFLSAKDGNFRNREPLFMVCDETDAWAKRFAASPKVQIDGRQKNLGARRKAMIMSHADLGWNSGVGNAWIDSSRGIYILRCADCSHYAAAHATKYWPDVPQFKLFYRTAPDAPLDDRLALAEESAAMLCPHCGTLLDDDQRKAMIDEAMIEGWGAEGWMHRGQTLDPLEGIMGRRDVADTIGWYVHGLMLKSVDVGKLARDLVKALDKFERTKDAKELREFMSKQLGEIFEGAATIGGLSVRGLKAQAQGSMYRLGEVPEGVKFITASVDTGGRKFDVGWWGWDLEGRSWLIDRLTIRQRTYPDGVARDIDVYRRFDDWKLLFGQVIDRRFPMLGKPGFELPVAVTCIDDGDGNATWKARQFQRVALQKRYVWGAWSKVKLIKGSRSAVAPPLPVQPRKVDKDEKGAEVAPIYEFDLGVHRLKEQSFERLAVSDGAPGQCYFPVDVDPRHLAEFFGESLQDGKWVRHGANETLDLFGYAEAGRQMLQPDRADINWLTKLPVWAKPVPARTEEGGDPEVATEEANEPPQSKESPLDRFKDLNPR